AWRRRAAASPEIADHAAKVRIGRNIVSAAATRPAALEGSGRCCLIVVGWTLLGADAVAEWTRRDAVIVAVGGISVLPPDQLILGVLDVAAAVDAEAFGDRCSAPALHVAGREVHRCTS